MLESLQGQKSPSYKPQAGYLHFSMDTLGNMKCNSVFEMKGQNRDSGCRLENSCGGCVAPKNREVVLDKPSAVRRRRAVIAFSSRGIAGWSQEKIIWLDAYLGGGRAAVEGSNNSRKLDEAPRM